MSKRFFIVTGIILITALTRLFPHPLNFAPLGAMSLFGAAYFSNRKWAFGVPLLAMFISDLLVNNILFASYYQSFTLFTPGFIWVYGSIAAIVFAGMLIFKKVTLPRVIGGSIAASVLFFLISNFGVWLADPDYPLTFSGLILCYDMAIPFFKNTLMGDLVYSAVLFGSFEFATYRISALKHI